MVGDGLTFCSSNTFTSEEFTTVNSGVIFIRDGIYYKTVNHGPGNNFVTFNGNCNSCF